MPPIGPVSTRIATTPSSTQQAPATRTPEVRLPDVVRQFAGECLFEAKGTNSGGNSTGTKVGDDGSCQLPPPPLVKEA